jgi:hypothetical protein
MEQLIDTSSLLAEPCEILINLIFKKRDMPELRSIPSHIPSVVATRSGNEYLLVPVTNNIADMDRMFTLNETGAFIWEHIDGKNSLEDIAGALANEYEVEYDDAVSDVLSFADDMQKFLVIESGESREQT